MSTGAVSHDPIAGPHTHTSRSVTMTMVLVILALSPATLFGLYIFGWPAINLLVLTLFSAWLAEIGALWLAGKPIRVFALDGSAILTGLLLALSLPPWAPWWIAVFGGIFAIVVGKHIFGGLGNNVFNPAMLARVALLISFPLEMTTWANPAPLFAAASPGFLEGIKITFIGFSEIDALSSASYLGHVKTELSQGATVTPLLEGIFQLDQALLGTRNGSLGETSALLLLAGGVLLLYKRVITWHIPGAMLLTIVLVASLMNFLSPEQYPHALFHVLAGSTLLGAFFIATDLVTSPSTKRGQILFGVGCGLLTYVIRTWGGYPEGVSFAVLIMNSLTPLIDYYIRPRIYGRTHTGAPVTYTPKKIKKQLHLEDDAS